MKFYFLKLQYFGALLATLFNMELLQKIKRKKCNNQVAI